MVCHQTYKSKDGKWLFPKDVEKIKGKYYNKINGEEVVSGRIEKMSKSKKNVVDPLSIVEKYGSDTAVSEPYFSTIDNGSTTFFFDLLIFSILPDTTSSPFILL